MTSLLNVCSLESRQWKTVTRVSSQDSKKERKRFDPFIIINVNGDNLTRKGIMTMSHFREASSVPFLSPLQLAVHCFLLQGLILQYVFH